MPSYALMNLAEVDRLIVAAERGAARVERNRSHLVPLLDEATVLLGRSRPSSVPTSLGKIASELRFHAEELHWRRRYLATHAPAIPGTSLRFGAMPRRRPHPDGEFGAGPFSTALAGLGPSPSELDALDQLATADLEQFLALRQVAHEVASPFDWSVGGVLWFGACSGPVPAAGEDACVRHDFIYRNWRRLRDDYAIDPHAADSVKSWADARLGDDVHDAVKHDWRTLLNPVNLATGGVPIVPFLWAEAVEPVVETFGDGAWYGTASSQPATSRGDYYGDVAPPSGPPSPLVTDGTTAWLCPDDTCAVDDG